MRVLFVYQGFECLALEYLSANLKRYGHETRLAFEPALFNDVFINKPFLAKFFHRRKALIQEAIDFQPDVVAFGALSPFFLWSVEIAKEMKQAINVPIIFGGLHVTGAPESALRRPWIDYVIEGEGEFPLLYLLEALEGNRAFEDVPNLWYRREDKLVNNQLEHFRKMDELPWPDKALFADISEHFLYGYTIAGTRGCPMRCSFCTETMMAKKSAGGEKGYLRKRSVDDMIEELTYAKKRYGINHIRFYDDILTWDKRWFAELSSRLKSELNLPYWCFIYPSVVDEWTVNQLEETGCYEVEMGIQSISETTRREVFGRKETNEQVKRAIHLLKNSKITAMVDNIIGVPGQDENELRDMVSFYSQNRPDHVNAFWLSYFPGTPIVDIAKDRGVLSDQDIAIISGEPITRSFYDKRPHDDKETIKLQNYLQIVLYLPHWMHEIILKHSLYRYFPTFDALFAVTILVRLVLRDKRRYPHLEGRLVRKYAFYGPKILLSKVKAALSGRSSAPALPTAPRPSDFSDSPPRLAAK